MNHLERMGVVTTPTRLNGITPSPSHALHAPQKHHERRGEPRRSRYGSYWSAGPRLDAVETAVVGYTGTRQRSLSVATATLWRNWRIRALRVSPRVPSVSLALCLVATGDRAQASPHPVGVAGRLLREARKPHVAVVAVLVEIDE